jgi:hypothetical protein
MKRISTVALLIGFLAAPIGSASTYYVVERYRGDVWAVHSESGDAQVVASGLGEMIGVTVDRGGRLFVSQFRFGDPQPGIIAIVDPVSGEFVPIDAMAEVFALSADPDADVLYVGGYTTGFVYHLEETSPSAWTVTTEVDLGAKKRVSHALRDGNSLYVACQDSGIWVKDLVAGTVTFGVDIPLMATTMAKEKGGDLIVGSEWGTVYRVDPSTWQVVRTYTGFAAACGIAVDSRDNTVLVSDPLVGQVSRLDLTTGDFVTVTTLPVEPWQIVCVPESSNPASDFTCSTNGSTVTITGYTGAGGEVVIPEAFDNLPVVSIGESAFSRCITLTALTIPNTVTNIGGWAFASCSSLASIAIPENVVSIGEGAFDSCSSLTTVTVPRSVIRVGSGAFRGCTSLTAITVDVLNPTYSSLEGVLFDKHQTSLIQCPAGKAGSYTIPTSVTSVGDWAFELCSRLTSITIPDSVSRLGNGAFLRCNGPTSVEIPNSVVSLGDEVFSGWTNLIGIAIPGSITSIAEKAFSDCIGLGNVSIAEGVNFLADAAFSGCSSLTNITLPDSITSLGNETFSGCSALPSLTLPNRLTSVGVHAFSNCSSLTNLAIPDILSSIGDWAFAGCSNLATVTIPNGVPLLGDGTFYGCTSLTSLVIPESVITLGMLAFGGCTSLTSLRIPDGVSHVGDRAFAGCTSLVDVSVGTTLASLGDDPFSLCTGLSAITVEAMNPKYSSVDGVLFNKNRTLLVRHPLARAGSYTIPEGVTSIGSSAFSGCASLTSVTVPHSVDSIASFAFFSCSNLINVFFIGDAPIGTPVPDSRFADSSPTICFLPGSTGWDLSFADRPTALWIPITSSVFPIAGVSSLRLITSSPAPASVRVQRSVNLLDWQDWQTVSRADGPSELQDPNASATSCRFYRGIEE